MIKGKLNKAVKATKAFQEYQETKTKMQKDKLNKDELKGYIKAFKKYAGYSLSEQEYNEKLKQLNLKQNR